MAHHLVRQKNGLLAVYSDVTRTLIDSDATEDELIEAYANEASEKARKATRDWIAGKGQHASAGHVLYAMHRGYMEHQLSPAHRAEIQEARRILERPDLPEAVPEKQAEVKNAAEEGARLMQAAVIKNRGRRRDPRGQLDRHAHGPRRALRRAHRPGAGGPERTG